MEENLSSHVLLENEFSTESQKLASLEAGAIVCSKSMLALAKEIGFARSVKSFFVRYRYTLRLWLLRESKILQILSENYEKVPKWTISKVSAWLLVTFPALKRLIVKVEKGLKQSLIASPFYGLTMNNNN